MNTANIVQKFWNYCNVLRDEALADSGNLPPPEVGAQEIVDGLEAALAQFREIAEDLGPDELAEA